MIDIDSLSIFHSGFFAALYLITALAVYVYHNDIKSTIPLAWVSLGSALAHILVFIVSQIAPDNPYLNVGLSSYYAWASPTIMLCIKEATSPGWFTLKRFIRYVGPFMVCTLLCLLTANTYILYIATVYSILVTLWAFVVLSKAIALREKLVKEFFTDLESFGKGWVKSLMYFQVITALCMFVFLFWHNVGFNILWNYIMAGFWLYFLIKSKQRHYFSLQVPKEFAEEFKALDHKTESYVIMPDNISSNALPLAEPQTAQQESVTASEPDASNETTTDNAQEEKSSMSATTLEFIERRLNELDDRIYYENSGLTLASLANMVGTNRTYMSVYFRAKDTTFWDYVNTKRCDHAIELMKQNKMISMNELASLCGFRTTNCLRTTFTTLYGINPSNYKKTIL